MTDFVAAFIARQRVRLADPLISRSNVRTHSTRNSISSRESINNISTSTCPRIRQRSNRGTAKTTSDSCAGGASSRTDVVTCRASLVTALKAVCLRSLRTRLRASPTVCSEETSVSKRRKKLWRYSAGDRGSTVEVFEREPGGMLYARVWDPASEFH